MNYELAKKLKDAGFPVKYPDNLFVEGEKSAYIPTLSELIEACGDRFECLSKVENQWWVDERGGFFSNGETATYGGSTPEEAVAKLWLGLNKKIYENKS